MSKYITTHWGTYKVLQDKENNILLDYWDQDSYPTKFGLSFVDTATDNLRIKQPYIRKGWLKNKGINNNNRGRDEFIPMSWNEALDIAANELLEIKNTFGNSSIYAGSYGWASAGRFHHAKSQVNRFFNMFGGFSSSYQSYSYAAAQTLLPHIIGLDLTQH